MRLEKSIQIKSTNPMAILDALTQEDQTVLNKSANNHIMSAQGEIGSKYLRNEFIDSPSVDDQILSKLSKRVTYGQKSYSKKTSFLSTISKHIRNDHSSNCEGVNPTNIVDQIMTPKTEVSAAPKQVKTSTMHNLNNLIQDHVRQRQLPLNKPSNSYFLSNQANNESFEVARGLRNRKMVEQMLNQTMELPKLN
ncbi:hypothetical protein FGO68_gene4854 [Halteria grandinella]|uniref:Uncharacterized protein n=1 Tax=Halteria grandinella TaxID=5974 RepID=A0A8J8P190_HALGN|nr:hypothetical protein FGO68_gene4854 [Halteria grandinella]